MQLVRAALSGWSPSTHQLHHRTFQTAVHTLLLVVERLSRMADGAGVATAIAIADARTDGFSSHPVTVGGADSFSGGDTSHSGANSPIGSVVANMVEEDEKWLPPELWLEVAGFFLRSDWSA
jgi:hypothetical protein